MQPVTETIIIEIYSGISRVDLVLGNKDPIHPK